MTVLFSPNPPVPRHTSAQYTLPPSQCGAICASSLRIPLLQSTNVLLENFKKMTRLLSDSRKKGWTKNNTSKSSNSSKSLVILWWLLPLHRCQAHHCHYCYQCYYSQYSTIVASIIITGIIIPADCGPKHSDDKLNLTVYSQIWLSTPNSYNETVTTTTTTTTWFTSRDMLYKTQIWVQNCTNNSGQFTASADIW